MKRLLVGLFLVVAGCSQTGSLTGSPGGDAKSQTSSVNSVPDAAPSLVVGSKAPPLAVGRFLQGEPVTSFEPGKIYVVEFWATWCAPCVAAMPHVSQLQTKYPEVTFIGVNIWEDEEDAAEKFLKTNGDKIGYRIARDKIPAGAKGRDGAMSESWLTAAGSSGIPEAFVVDGEGRIALITHPMSLGESLPQIISGKWDIKAAAKEHLQAVMQSRKSEILQDVLNKLIEAGPSDETLVNFDKLQEAFPDEALQITLTKFRLLAASNAHAEKALTEGRKLLASDFAKQSAVLNAIAWELVSPERIEPATASLKKFAVEVARRADEQSEHKHSAIADTLARALFVSGDAKEAVEAQRRAISLAEAEAKSKPVEFLDELKQSLTEYEKAASSAKAD